MKPPRRYRVRQHILDALNAATGSEGAQNLANGNASFRAAVAAGNTPLAGAYTAAGAGHLTDWHANPALPDANQRATLWTDVFTRLNVNPVPADPGGWTPSTQVFDFHNGPVDSSIPSGHKVP